MADRLVGNDMHKSIRWLGLADIPHGPPADRRTLYYTNFALPPGSFYHPSHKLSALCVAKVRAQRLCYRRRVGKTEASSEAKTHASFASWNVRTQPL